MGDDRHQGGYMIYLLEGHELSISNVREFIDRDSQTIVTSYTNFTMQKTIQHKLELAAKTGELIHTQWLRYIGKTHELVRFAKANNYLVFEPNDMLAKEIATREKYDNVFPWSSDMLRGRKFTKESIVGNNSSTNVVIDEGVENLEALKDLGFNIVTGFYAPKKEEERSFAEKVTQTLKNEIESLTPKLEKCRENGDYGTYKNLINAYREVLGLLRDSIRDSGRDSGSRAMNQNLW